MAWQLGSFQPSPTESWSAMQCLYASTTYVGVPRAGWCGESAACGDGDATAWSRWRWDIAGGGVEATSVKGAGNDVTVSGEEEPSAYVRRCSQAMGRRRWFNCRRIRLKPKKRRTPRFC